MEKIMNNFVDSLLVLIAVTTIVIVGGWFVDLARKWKKEDDKPWNNDEWDEDGDDDSDLW